MHSQKSHHILTDFGHISFKTLRERSSENDDIPINMLTQSIWFNKKLKIDNTLVCFFYCKWCDAGIFFINDLLDENNEFLSFNRLKKNVVIEPICLQYLGILHMILQIWKVRIKLTNKSQ
jgi:serine phosphatase RsbU (regulator of sigma subunit)